MMNPTTSKKTNIFLRISETFKSYLRTGVEKATTPEEKRNIYNINLLNIVTSTLILTIGFGYYTIAPKIYLIIPVIVEGILFGLIPLINKFGTVRLANNITYYLHCICACYFGCILGIVIEIQLLIAFFIMAALTSLFTQEPTDRIIYIACSIATLIAMEINYYYNIIPALDLTRDQSFIFRWAAMFGILTLIIMVFRLYDKRTTESHQKLTLADEAKTEFVRTISHEIRVPLNSILQVSTILEREVKNNPELEHLHPFIKTLYSSAFLTKGIVNNVLSLAAIEEGKLHTIDNREFNLKRTLGNVIDMNHNATSAKRVTIKLQYDENMPSVILGDELKITQVFNNILINAIKYTQPKTSIKVNVEQTEHQWILSICDKGPGMTPEQVAAIEREQSFNTTASDLKIEGTGLGLFIATKLINLLNGNYKIVSSPGSGTTFIIDFPLNIPASNPATDEKSAITLNLYGYRTLVVEDDPLSTMLLKYFLGSLGADVYTASNTSEGIMSANKYKPHIILVDGCLPKVGDGENTIRAIRSNPAFEKTMIIGVPGNAFEPDINSLLTAGANACCPKPISHRDLEQILYAFTENYQEA
ncbi:hybrid sensor histidine kinase/response regulator [Chitinophaga sp. HK235]|uniref:hybrid sensor histidine kinase/response regulator n=1 Tax=Chitinophaga sp. HK235 TaxID=2952571 RepID=UPI001BA48B80|nr:hybrid sensor histidine kinase/response regulator [Chitinophaga sp. HK235]